MSSYHKYQKYKLKYQQQKLSGGNKTDYDIVKFIKKEDLNTIQESLLKNMDNKTYCDKILGKGLLGEVSVPTVNNKMDITLKNDTKITIPVVIKKANSEGQINIKMIDNKLCIYANLDITLGAIILSYINKLWHKKLSPHLPFMIGYSCCENKENIRVNKIITERHGLNENVKFDIEGFTDEEIWHGPRPGRIYKSPYVFDSEIGTLDSLCKYIFSKMKNGNVILPNGETCNVVELFDYLAISFIHTHQLLHKHNIIISDMHSNNIFIHWLNNDSYLGDTNISKVKYINYKFGDKILKIKTFGLLLKIGDVGTAIITPRKDVLILGQANDLDKNIKLVDQIIKPNYQIYWGMTTFKYMLPQHIYEKTIMSSILDNHPYNEIVNYLPMPYKLLDKFLDPNELLAKYDKYFVDKTSKSDDTLIVEEY